MKPLISSWQPADTTVIAALVQPGVREPGGNPFVTLVAVPAAGGSATPLITIPSSGGWDFRADGSELVVSAEVSQNTSRLASWDLRSGVLRWLTPEDAGTKVFGPRWSPDGAFVYFGSARFAEFSDRGILRVRADGTGLQRVRDPLPKGLYVSIPRLVVDPGVLIWQRSYEGTSVEVLELASRRESSFEGCAYLHAWRPTRPHALVATSACGLGHVGSGLVLWDDVSGQKTTLADPSSQLTMGADWDLTGTRIVTALRATNSAEPFALVTMDDRGGSRERLAGTEGARAPLWLGAGIVYLWPAEDLGVPPSPTAFELRRVAPTGGAYRTLYRSNDPLLDIRFVRP